MDEIRKECSPVVYAMGCAVLILIMFICLLFCSQCHAQGIPEKQKHAQKVIDKNRFVNAIIGESENSREGMLWVACTIRNRGSLRGVYGEKSVRVRNRLYSSRVFVQAVKAYEDSSRQDVTGGCRYWFSDSDLKMPKVKRIIRLEHLELVRKVGGNSFFRVRS